MQNKSTGVGSAHSPTAAVDNGIPYAVQHFAALPDDAGLTPRESAIVLRIGLSTYWAWLAQGRLAARRIGRTTRTTAGELRRLMAGGA